MRNITYIILLCSSTLFAQNVKRINDEAVVAQEKRMVFQQWGDWKPRAKYILGIQVSYWYGSVWGDIYAPPENRRYRNGEDIRPLKPTGLETQRNGLVLTMKERADEIKVYSDTLSSRARADFLHWTSLTSQADPLYLLYYKRMLRPLREMSDNPSNYIEWGFSTEESYQIARRNGTLNIIQRELELLKDDFRMATTVDMPRGKRFIKYHHILMGWRKLQRIIRSADEIGITFKKSKQKLDALNTQPTVYLDDKAIVENIMEQYKNDIF